MRDFTPRPYQIPIAQHIIRTPRCAVWADMGMGKTSAVLYALSVLDLVKPHKTLILAPLRVARSVWPQEVAKWAEFAHMRVQPILGDAGDRLAALREDADIYTINYDNLTWLAENIKGPWPYDVIVADESTRLKGYRTRQGGKRARALADKAFTRQGARFITLTGTPAPNGLQDLWGQYFFLDKGLALGRSFAAFSSRWFMRDPRGGIYGRLIPQAHARGEIEQRIRRLTISVRAEDWFKDLQNPVVRNIVVDMPEKAKKIYADFAREMYAELEAGPIEALSAAAKTIKCLQLSNGAAYIDASGQYEETHKEKLYALESVIEEAAGMPVLVAYHFKSDLARLKKHFPAGKELDKKQKTLDEWNDGRIPVLFAHPGSAGHGLNLQDGGNIIVFFGHWWDLEQRQQIIERIGPVRQLQAGHNRLVHIYNIVSRGTVDTVVLRRHETKKEIQDLLIESRRQKPEDNDD